MSASTSAFQARLVEIEPETGDILVTSWGTVQRTSSGSGSGSSSGSGGESGSGSNGGEDLSGGAGGEGSSGGTGSEGGTTTNTRGGGGTWTVLPNSGSLVAAEPAAAPASPDPTANSSGSSENETAGEPAFGPEPDYARTRFTPGVELPESGDVPDTPDQAGWLNAFVDRFAVAGSSGQTTETTLQSETIVTSTATGVLTSSFLRDATKTTTATVSAADGDVTVMVTLVSMYQFHYLFAATNGDSWELEQTGSQSYTFSGQIDYDAGGVTGVTTVTWGLSELAADGYHLERSRFETKTDSATGEVTTLARDEEYNGTQSYQISATQTWTRDDVNEVC